MPTKIEWADEVWNPVTGCSHAGSPGCDNCYARRMSQRLKGRYGYPADDPFRVTFHADKITQPLHWDRQRRIFVCSMSDLFQERVADEWIQRIWKIMARCQRHTFLVLTKRPGRMGNIVRRMTISRDLGEYTLTAKEASYPPYLPNLWLGVTVENGKHLDRISTLLQIPAAKRFVSIEPMLGPVSLLEWTDTCSYYCDHGEMYPEGHWPARPKFDWVIVGQETGPNARPAKAEWFNSLIDQCRDARVPVFIKKAPAGVEIIREMP